MFEASWWIVNKDWNSRFEKSTLYEFFRQLVETVPVTPDKATVRLVTKDVVALYESMQNCIVQKKQTAFDAYSEKLFDCDFQLSQYANWQIGLSIAANDASEFEAKFKTGGAFYQLIGAGMHVVGGKLEFVLLKHSIHDSYVRFDKGFAPSVCPPKVTFSAGVHLPSRYKSVLDRWLQHLETDIDESYEGNCGEPFSYKPRFLCKANSISRYSTPMAK